MNTLKTERHKLEIADNSILITGNGERYVLQILTTNDFESETRYFCSNLETGGSAEVIHSGNSIALHVDDRILFQEQCVESPSTGFEVNINVDHSRTINTLTQMATDSGKRVFKLLSRLAGIAATLIVIWIIASLVQSSYEKSQIIYARWETKYASVNGGPLEKINMLLIRDIRKDGTWLKRVDRNQNGGFERDEETSSKYSVKGDSFIFEKGDPITFKVTDSTSMQISYRLDDGNLFTEFLSRYSDL